MSPGVPGDKMGAEQFDRRIMISHNRKGLMLSLHDRMTESYFDIALIAWHSIKNIFAHFQSPCEFVASCSWKIKYLTFFNF